MSISQKEIQSLKTKEYDLFDLIYTLWKEKTKIFLIVFLSLFSVFVSFQYFQKIKISYSVDYIIDKNFYSLLTSNSVNVLSAINYEPEDFADILDYNLNDERAITKAIDDNLEIKKFVQFYKINELNSILNIRKKNADDVNYTSSVSYITSQNRHNIIDQSILSPEEFIIEIVNEVALQLNTEFSESLNNEINSLDNQIRYFKDDLKLNKDREHLIILNEYNIKTVELEQKLDFLKNKLNYIKDKEIRELQDALTIAYKLNIIKPKFIEELSNISNLTLTSKVEKKPLFFLGSDTLNIMINDLKNKDLQYFDDDLESSNIKYIDVINKINKLEYNKKQDLIILNLKMNEINDENIKLLKNKKNNINRAIIEINNLRVNPFIMISNKVSKKIEKNKNRRVYILTILFSFVSACFVFLIKNEIYNRSKKDILL